MPWHLSNSHHLVKYSCQGAASDQAVFREQSFQPLRPQVRDDHKSSSLSTGNGDAPEMVTGRARQREVKRESVSGFHFLLLASGDSESDARKQAPKAPARLFSKTRVFTVRLRLALQPETVDHSPTNCSDCYPAPSALLPFSRQNGTMTMFFFFQLLLTTWKPSPSLISPPRARMS